MHCFRSHPISLVLWRCQFQRDRRVHVIGDQDSIAAVLTRLRRAQEAGWEVIR